MNNNQDKTPFKARMTQVQFESLAYKLRPIEFLGELVTNKHFLNFKPCKGYDIKLVSAYLINGWNTEYILRFESTEFDKSLLKNSLHWAFPKTYYSIFSVILAFFKIAGLSEHSHSNVIKKFGSLVSSGFYPQKFSFFAKGFGKIEYENIVRTSISHPLYFELKSEIADTQICQLLKSTREMELKEKKKRLKIKNGKQKIKLRLSKKDWKFVSDTLGYTTLLSYLYRKRIKANYLGIDTFLSEYISSDSIYSSLIRIVETCNILHEAYIIKSIGIVNYGSIVNKLAGEPLDIISKRMLTIQNKLNSKAVSCIL